jgi:hypothetical protein
MEGIVIPDLKKKPRFLSKGAAQVPVLMHFQQIQRCKPAAFMALLLVLSLSDASTV